MKQKVYKVVARIERSQKLVSAFVHKYDRWENNENGDCLTRIYEIGKEVFPIEGTKLFAFSVLHEAKTYCEIVADYETGPVTYMVYEADAEISPENQEIKAWFANFYTLEMIKESFEFRSFDKHKSLISSVACDSITLTKEIYVPRFNYE
jgi:hypothetical protein